MNISQTGIKLIQSFEGCVLHAYKDAVGVPTIGWGHTGGVTLDQKITQAQADTLLIKDLQKFEDGVDKAVTREINQNQFDALVSFSYNCGLGNLGKSTLLKKVNAGDFVGAAKEFAKWNKAGGEVLAGLTKRRKAEAELFAKPVVKKSSYPGHLIGVNSTDHVNVKRIQALVHVTVDGLFGPGTLRGIVNWQLRHGLKGDGIVGKITWDKMFPPK